MMIMKRTILLIFICVSGLYLLGQEKPSKAAPDSGLLHTQYLPDIKLVGRNTKADIHFLPEIVGTTINAGKKNALIMMDNIQGNVVTNT
ncbi:MAG: hypothetical protein RJB16_881, partial [Bacteroidota bacterium]